MEPTNSVCVSVALMRLNRWEGKQRLLHTSLTFKRAVAKRSSESINRNRSLGLFTGHTLFLCCAHLRKACTHVSPRKLWTVTKEGSEIAIRVLVTSNLVRLGKANCTNWTRPCALGHFSCGGPWRDLPQNLLAAQGGSAPENRKLLILLTNSSCLRKTSSWPRNLSKEHKRIMA